MIITPEIWGPYGWKFIHMVALAYPLNPTEEDKLNYYNFFKSISNILPCHLCSDHYKTNLKKYPLNDEILSTRENIVKWTIDMHNEVNISNNKKVYDYITAIKLINNNYNSESEIIKENEKKSEENNKAWVQVSDIEKTDNKNSSILYILFLIFIGLIIIAVLYKKL